MKKRIVFLVAIFFLVGCTQSNESLTFTSSLTAEISLTPATPETPKPTEPSIPIEIQSQLDKLNTSGVNGFETHDGNIYSSEGSIISVDSLGVITTPSETGLSWWNSETKKWDVVNPISPETYPQVYIEHWNSLTTRTPVSEPTAEDIAFNDFQVETYRDFFPSIQSNLNQDPLWQTFFQANGSDFSTMTADQIYQAYMLYGQTSKEALMPIVLFEQQNQANPDNWKFTYETNNSDGIVFPAPESEIDFAINLFKKRGHWGFNQKFLGTIINIEDNIPISQMRGTILYHFRVPGVDPDIEVGLAVSTDDGKHLDVGTSFEDVTIYPGDLTIGYFQLNERRIITPSPDEKNFPALTDIGLTKITRKQLQELIGTLQLLDIGAPVGDINRLDVFSKNSGLQLVGIIWK